MKTVCLAAALLMLSQNVVAQNDTVKAEYGWLQPGHFYFGFGHRVATTSAINPVLDKYYRGKFVFWWWKPIISRPKWMIDLTAAPQLLYGGFYERSFILPAFNFRGELAFRYRWDEYVVLYISSLHYSTHAVDKLPISTPEELAALQQVEQKVNDVNVLRIGVMWKPFALGPIQQFSGHVGSQPIKMNYWFIGGGDLMFKKSSYEKYDRRAYFELQASSTLGGQRLLFKIDGEFWQTLRYLAEIRWSTQLSDDPMWDGLQIFLAYEGVNIGPNEVAITPYNGVSRDWLVLGFRIAN
ncbi:TPA: hypothetical protein DIC39_00070 [Patescibacteria group bacterium]|nr:MAG: hypothetical protein UX54_C0015G0010 [Parcubacteria group bacterium GW2011_GWA2_46_39]HBV33634.1 hypothetical protein [Patescibacteria group bacterium]HCU47450.1 hypothetical protein [Patescibacteria group bacterium]